MVNKNEEEVSGMTSPLTYRLKEVKCPHCGILIKFAQLERVNIDPTICICAKCGKPFLLIDTMAIPLKHEDEINPSRR